MVPLMCTGADGVVRRFFMDVRPYADPTSRGWEISVHLRDPPRPDQDDLYYSDFRVRPNGSDVQPISLMHNKQHYSAKGITEALFRYIATVSGLTLVSSSNLQSQQGDDAEFRTSKATAVWERL